MKPAGRLIVILGLNEKGKAHAARFDGAQADAVRRAASLMGFRTALPETEEAEKLVARLPAGKLFAAGKGLVPLVKADLYEQLTQKLALEEPVKSEAPSSAPEGPDAGSKAIWDAIKVGSV